MTGSTPPLNQGIASGKSFEERAGTPDELTSSVGYVVFSFSWLEQLLDRAICRFLRAPEEAVLALAAEMSFKQKVHAFASLAQSVGPEDRLGKIVAACFRAEELRNVVLHSYWESVPHYQDRAVRFKRTGKAKRGLHTQVEELDCAIILDVADYIESVASSLTLFITPLQHVVA